jgi:hypothetical protein
MFVSDSWPDNDWLQTYVEKVAHKYPHAKVVHGGTRGKQKVINETATNMGLELIEVGPDPSVLPNYKAAVKAMHVCMLADQIMCFWGGTADGVKTLMTKALMVHRPEPRFYPGLHVYEATRTRKKKGGRGGDQTGKVKHRVRHSFDLVSPEQAVKLRKRHGDL